MADDEDDRIRRATLDLARAEAHLREALRARGVEGAEDVAAAQRALLDARARLDAVARPRPPATPGDGAEAKSWGSH